ncbi:uncharacterized protein LOC127880935 [Dreissena polymorpha]|nr:uncharacterized protein LOC127880935 [Dreissena polymorpha]
MSRDGFHAQAGFHPGAVGATYTFVLGTPMYGRWVKVANHSPGNVLHLCEVQVEGSVWSPIKAMGSHKYAVFVNHFHTGTALAMTRNIWTDIICASQCSKTQNCVSAHYNKATLTCSLFDTLNFQIGGGADDVIIVISYYTGAVA